MTTAKYGQCKYCKFYRNEYCPILEMSTKETGFCDGWVYESIWKKRWKKVKLYFKFGWPAN